MDNLKVVEQNGIRVCMTDTDIFSGLLGIVKEILSDVRIDGAVRHEYNLKIKKLTDSNGRTMLK